LSMSPVSVTLPLRLSAVAQTGRMETRSMRRVHGVRATRLQAAGVPTLATTMEHSYVCRRDAELHRLEDGVLRAGRDHLQSAISIQHGVIDVSVQRRLATSG
jgi:hypothetical protein